MRSQARVWDKLAAIARYPSRDFRRLGTVRLYSHRLTLVTRAQSRALSLEMGDRPAKRLKVASSDTHHQEPAGPTIDCLDDPTNPSSSRSGRSLASLTRSITPPPRLRSRLPSQSQQSSVTGVSTHQAGDQNVPKLISSPIQLTNIRDLPASSGNNVDTIRLRDILGDPMIRECWQFNFLHDVDFIMSQFDEDVRALVQVKIVHGSWKKEAPNRIRIDVSASAMAVKTRGMIQELLFGKASLTNLLFPGTMCTVSECGSYNSLYARAIWHTSFQDDGYSTA